MSDTEHPRKNPHLETSPFDSDASGPMILCVLPSIGENVRFAVPEKYLDLISFFDGRRSEDAAIDAFLDANSGSYERDWLKRLVRQSLIPKGLIVEAHRDASQAGVSSQPKRGFLYIKLPILPSTIVAPIARCFSFMFFKPMMAIGLLIFILSHVYVYGVLIQADSVDFDKLDTTSVLLIMLFSTLATICHEFGHASAAAHYGCRRMSIGWGVYIVYTVLWTNVSEAWKLPRHHRAIVDAGGIYFESLALFALLAAYLHTGNTLFLLAFVFIDFSILNTLNPFLRMDGYWLVSDIFGIVNLRKQQMNWLQDIANKFFGNGEYRESNTLSKIAKRVLVVYSALGVAFFVYLLFVLFNIVVFDIATGFPTRLSGFADAISSGAPALEIISGALEILWRTVMLVGASYMLFSLLQRFAKMLSKIRMMRQTALQISVH